MTLSLSGLIWLVSMLSGLIQILIVLILMDWGNISKQTTKREKERKREREGQSITQMDEILSGSRPSPSSGPNIHTKQNIFQRPVGLIMICISPDLPLPTLSTDRIKLRLLISCWDWFPQTCQSFLAIQLRHWLSPNNRFGFGKNIQNSHQPSTEAAEKVCQEF